ncbi:MAG: hypothetical protein AAFY17_05575, partial [Cyanobacteria bacterium J06642_11]
MGRIRLVFTACLSFLIVVSGAVWKKALAVSLCGLLFANTPACYSWLSHQVYAAIPGSIDEEIAPAENEIAIPPI